MVQYWTVTVTAVFPRYQVLKEDLNSQTIVQETAGISVKEVEPVRPTRQEREWGESGIQADHNKKRQRQGQGARRRYRRYLGSRGDLLVCLINIYWASTKNQVPCYRNLQWLAMKVSSVQQGSKVMLWTKVKGVGLHGLLCGRWSGPKWEELSASRNIKVSADVTAWIRNGINYSYTTW